jgi:urease accessory protein
VTAAHQRARGELAIAFKRRGERTVLAELRQEGCLKARFPRTEPAELPCATVLNCAGGIAGGDALSVRVVGRTGTAATVTTQAAERVYRALPGARAEVATALRVEAGATLEWLPQETILFDGCALRRTLDVDVLPGGRFLGLESLVFGRAAMGEVVRSARLLDRVVVRRDGRRVLHDAIRLDGPVSAVLARSAVARGAAAVATLVLADERAEAAVDRLRAALEGHEAGVSAWDGLLVARILAPGGAALRAAVTAGLNILREGRTLPRVWMC